MPEPESQPTSDSLESPVENRPTESLAKVPRRIDTGETRVLGHDPDQETQVLPGKPDSRPGDGTRPSDIELPRRIGSFFVEKELARGGMGVIYVALSPQLEKRVAIKVLLKGKFASEEALERFHVEARAAARLRHPNIVGTHEVGEDNGRPYLVMDLIDGESLSARLKRDGPLEPEVAARMVQRLAEAVYFAHTRSILHRDIKPANILISNEPGTGTIRERLPNFGEPVLTDFGLAKEVDADDTRGVTESGQVMGTPAYMPPEQAEGALDRIDRRSDVYSLGATFYETLTGQPPFDGPTTMEVLRAVIETEPKAPSLLRPGLDPDLETICLKCLEKEPERRYSSAKELSDDLARALSDEPIVARPPSIASRARKWLRRNQTLARTLVGTSALAVVVMLIGSAVFMGQLRDERDSAENARLAADVARAEAEHQARRAQTRANIARDAVRSLVFEVKDKLADLPGQRVREARERLLKTAVDQLLRLREAEDRDAPRSLEAAEAYRQAGDLALLAGSSSRADEAFTKAVDICRGLLESNTDAGRDLGISLIKLGEVRRLRGDLTGALQAFQASLLALRNSSQAREALTRRHVALALIDVGDVRLEQGYLPKAETVYQEALGINRALLAAAPSSESKRDLVRALNKARRVWQAQGDFTRAQPALEESLKLARELVTQDPESALAKRTLASALEEAGTGRLALGKVGVALKTHTEALALRRALLSQDPKSASARRDLARSLNLLGETQRAGRDLLGALEVHREALDITRELLKQDPTNSATRRDLAASLSLLGEARLGLSRHEAALKAHQGAVETHRLLLAQAPSSARTRRDLASSLRRVGEVHRAQGNLTAAVSACEQALSLQRELFARASRNAAVRRDLSRCLLQLASLRRQAGDLRGARRDYDGAVSHLRALLVKNSKNAFLLQDLAESLTTIGDLHREEGDLASAFQRYRQALRNWRLLVKQAPRFREELARFQALLRRRKWEEMLLRSQRQPESADDHLLLALSHRRQKKYAHAVKHFRQALTDSALRGDLKRGLLYQAACAASLAAGAGSGQVAARHRGYAITWLADDLQRRQKKVAELDAKLETSDPKRKLPKRRRADLVARRRAYLQHFARARTDPALAGLHGMPEFTRLFARLPKPLPQ